MWHSAPAGITVEVIREIRHALEHGREVLVANADQLAVMTRKDEKQCKANRNGSVLNATALYASDDVLHRRLNRDGCIFLSKRTDYCHKTLFTADRAMIVPPRTNWTACIPTQFRRKTKC